MHDGFAEAQGQQKCPQRNGFGVKSERNPADYIGDMLEASGQIAQFIKGTTFEEFSADRKTQFAVIGGLEIIGEAIRNISPSLRQKYSKIPWREITGMRDRLIRDYIGGECSNRLECRNKEFAGHRTGTSQDVE